MKVMCDIIDAGNVDVTPSWASALLSALGPGSPPERVRLSAHVLARCQNVLVPLARERIEELLDSSAAAAARVRGDAGMHRSDKVKQSYDSDDEMSLDEDNNTLDAAGHAARKAPRQPRDDAVPTVLARFAAACPGALPTLASSLQHRLQSSDVVHRLICVRALGAVFDNGEQGCSPVDHRHVFALFLGRFQDANAGVRTAMARWAGHFVVQYVPSRSNGDGPVLQVMECLTQRLQDADDTVRAAAVTAVCAVATSSHARCPPATLRAVCVSLRDVKPAVQHAATAGLCAAYAAYVARLGAAAAMPASGPESQMFDPVLGALLSAAVMQDAATGGTLTVDSLLDGRLFSAAHCSPAVVAMCLVRAHACGGGAASKAGLTMAKVIALRGKPRALAARWLTMRRAGRGAQGHACTAEDAGHCIESQDADGNGLSNQLPAGAHDQAAQDALRSLACSWPKPHAAAAELAKLHAARDGHIFRALEGLLAADCVTYGVGGMAGSADKAQESPAAGVKSSSALRSDALRRLRAALGGGPKGGSHQLVSVLDQLCAKLAPQPVDARVVAHLLDILCALTRVGEHEHEGDDDNMGVVIALPIEGTSALAILQAAAEGAPACFAHSSSALLALLRARCPEVVTGTLRIIHTAASGLGARDGQQLARTWRAPLTALCTAGDARQAKLAARCLLALLPVSVSAVASGLLARLSSLSDETLPSALASAGALLAAPEVAGDTAENADGGSSDALASLLSFVCDTLAHRPHNPPVRGATNPHPVAALTACGVKAVVAATLPAAQGAHPTQIAAAKKVVDTLLVPLLTRSHDGVLQLNGSEASVDVVRQAAAKGLVKFALRCRAEVLNPTAFAALCVAMQSTTESSALRHAIRCPLLKHAARSSPMPARCVALTALAAGVAGAADRVPQVTGAGNDGAVVTAATVVPSAVRSCVWAIRMRLHSQQRQQRSATPQQTEELHAALAAGPEQALLYCLWGLAHCPHVPQQPEQWASADACTWLPHVQRPLEAVLDALLSGPTGACAAQLGTAGSHKHKAGAALPQLKRMLLQAKLSMPRGGGAAHVLHAAADVAEAVLTRRAAAHQWDASVMFPMQTPMPKHYFQMLAPGQEALQVLSPNQDAGARGARSSRCLLPPGFKLLPDAPVEGAGTKKRRQAAMHGDDVDDDSDADSEDNGTAVPTTAARMPRGKAGKGGAKKSRGNAAAHHAAVPPRRGQPKRAASKRVPLADGDDSNEDAGDLDQADAAPQPQPSPDGSPDPAALTAAAPKRFTLMVSLSADSDAPPETEADKLLNPVRRPAAPAPAVVPQPPTTTDQTVDGHDTGIRRTGRNARRRR